MKKIDDLVAQKIEQHKPKGNLDHTAKIVSSLMLVRDAKGNTHEKVDLHDKMVALIAEAVATRMKKDARAALFSGLTHDTGKVLQNAKLFDGHNITSEEYAEVKAHAVMGYEALKEHHLFTALVVGLHHAMAKKGYYGISILDIPSQFSPSTAKKALEIAVIISVADFIDAYTRRSTKILDGSDKGAVDLREMLYQKYPDDLLVIDIALEESPAIFALLSGE